MENDLKIDDLELELNNMQLRSVNVSNETISASDTNGLKADLLSFFGDYTTVVTDYTYQNQQGYTQHSIDVQPDYIWMITVAFFAFTYYIAMKFLTICSRGYRRRR